MRPLLFIQENPANWWLKNWNEPRQGALVRRRVNLAQLRGKRSCAPSPVRGAPSIENPARNSLIPPAHTTKRPDNSIFRCDIHTATWCDILRQTTSSMTWEMYDASHNARSVCSARSLLPLFRMNSAIKTPQPPRKTRPPFFFTAIRCYTVRSTTISFVLPVSVQPFDPP